MKVENQRLIEVCEYLMYQKKEQSLASISNAVFGHKNYFTALKRQDTNPSQMVINYLVDKHNVNSDYIWRGEGEMLKVPAVVTVYNPTSEERQEAGDGIDMSMYPAEVVEEIKAEVAEEIREEIIEEIREEIKEEIKQEGAITVIPVEIANQVDVDIKKYIEENESELEKLTPSDLTGDVDGVEKIRKDSMSPTFVPGDRVFIKFLKHKSHIIDGTVYYFNLRNRPTMIRQVKIEGDKLRLIAFNSQYSDIITDFDNVLRVAEVNGMYRSFFTNQYSEAESVRRKKDEQIDSLITEVSKAGERVDRMMEQMTTLVRHAIEKK